MLDFGAGSHASVTTVASSVSSMCSQESVAVEGDLGPIGRDTA
ncbi:hypothetical protein [Streptomyces heilongjiangensis]|uniref:Uncharacterized protein n=1 Tax=Streptomyces heilongjiangensis TaxID=945052 RepID=A0ABW1B4P1_9ACTN|nr:hypothetical protein [Streptomyces heilongjiangensis]MDC2947839.1 hypothetical protein [Streptomyces heilongjiangensis]